MSKDIVEGTLVPAYGRDYTDKQDVMTDFQQGKDFVLKNTRSRWDSTYCSIRDCEAEDMIKLRYDKLRKVTFYRVTEEDKIPRIPDQDDRTYLYMCKECLGKRCNRRFRKETKGIACPDHARPSWTLIAIIKD